jgi:tetratricopeptide (TPR) repeat protein
MALRRLHRHLSTLRAVALAVAAFCVTAPSAAIPSLKDQWHFFCGPAQVTGKLVARARGKTGGGGVKGGIAQLNYACLLELREMQLFQDRYTKWADAGGKGAQPKLDNRASAAALAQATATLGGTYKSSKSNPKALYYYGLALALKGDVLTVNVLDELMTNHKSYKLVGDAYLVLGDHYFERRDLPKAFREYGNALKEGKSIVQSYTRYKMAWVNFALALEQKNAQKQSKAIQDLVNLKKRLDGTKGKKEKRLADLISSDVSDLLAQQGNLAEAKRILKAMNADDVYASVLERMANVKLGANDIEGAYQLFALSLREGPGRVEALQIASSMVQIAAQKNDVKRLTDMLKYMIGNYTQGKTPWRNAQKANKAAVAKAAAQVEAMVIDYAAAIDNQGRQANDPAMLNAARGLYELFMKSFKKSKRLRDVKTQYGTLLYLQKLYLPSAKVLHEVLTENPKDKSAKDLAALMVTAAQYAVDNDKTKYPAVDPGTPKDEKPRPIPAVKKVFADSLDMFVKLTPADPNAPAMVYASAAVYYDFGHFPEAVKRLDAYITKYPANDFAKQAAAKLLTYHLRQNDKKSLDKLVARLATNAAIGDAPEVQPLMVKAKEKLKDYKKGSDESEAEEGDGESDGKDKKKKKSKKKKKKSSDESADGNEAASDEAAGNGSEEGSNGATEE